MLTNPIMDKLTAMRLTGMAKALTEQMEMQDLNSLTFDERLGLMVDREMLDREDRRLATRLRKAKLRVAACMEDIDFRHKRGLDKSLVMSLAGCQWITGRQNLIITGPTGVGKTYLACALVHKACLMGHSAVYRRLPVNDGVILHQWSPFKEVNWAVEKSTTGCHFMVRTSFSCEGVEDVQGGVVRKGSQGLYC
jgi:DNA replication protein DnaC